MKNWDMVLFTLEGCKHCEMLKDSLETLEIPFKNMNVSTNKALGDQLEKTYKCYSYPVIILKQPTQIAWLPETELLPSPSIRTYFNMYALIDDIFDTFNK